MNRITNKEYLIEITINSLQTSQSPTISKVKSQVHYTDGGYLRFKVQPYLKNGSALFNNQRLRVPYDSQVSLVFKLIKKNKKQIFIGHYTLELQNMLAQKLFQFKIRDKLEESDAYVDFECRIFDKELMAESDTQELQLETFTKKKEFDIRSNPAFIRPKLFRQRNQSTRDTFTNYERAKIIKKQSNIPLPPEEYAKLVIQAEDILKKRHKFQQRQIIILQYSRDKKGRLKSLKIQALKKRLDEVKRQKFNSNLLLYVIISVIAFFIGMKI